MVTGTVDPVASSATGLDRVEVVRGANGMMTGVGNPSATVNYVRKRPTDDFEASLTGEAGWAS